MKGGVNIQALNSAAKVLTNQVKALEGQGYEEMYFTAQFFIGDKKQNGIMRGDVTKISKQVRDYVKSEEADAMNVEIFEEGTSKSIYRKKFFQLYDKAQGTAQHEHDSSALNGQKGLGAAEVNELVSKGLSEGRREDEFNRLNKEVEELRSKYTALESEKEELEATVKAKKDIEFYTGIIGAAFPGLAPLFNGTPLAQAAGFLAGTSDMNGNAITAKETSEEVSSISSLVSEFYSTLNTQEAGTMHILFMMFEKDKSQIQRALQLLTTNAPATT